MQIRGIPFWDAVTCITLGLTRVKKEVTQADSYFIFPSKPPFKGSLPTTTTTDKSKCVLMFEM